MFHTIGWALRCARVEAEFQAAYADVASAASVSGGAPDRAVR